VESVAELSPKCSTGSRRGKQRKREWGEEREEERRQGEEVYTNILYFILVSLGRC